ncbi:hypothetical protein LCGC14_2009300, partial [marine sediment metagenome]
KNKFGQVGIGFDTYFTSSPVEVELFGGGVSDNIAVSISSGSDHNCALLDTNEISCWGENNKGQLGLGDTTNRSIPVRVGTGNNWKQIACGGYYFVGYHTAAIKTDGTLWTWGYNEHGQLGLGDTTDRSIPVRVGTDTNWKQVACGDRNTLAIKIDGTLWAWGLNSLGQLGLGDITDRWSPVQVGSDSDWMNIACGYYHTLAIKTEGALWAWGYNNSGQIGDGTNIDKKIPTRIGTDTNWASVDAGGHKNGRCTLGMGI